MYVSREVCRLKHCHSEEICSPFPKTLVHHLASGSELELITPISLERVPSSLYETSDQQKHRLRITMAFVIASLLVLLDGSTTRHSQ